MDDQLYQDTFSSPADVLPKTTSKSLLYVTDVGSADYSTGQITFESNQISNSGRYLSFGEGYLSIPITASVTGDDTVESANSDLLLAIKGSNYSFIHSISISTNNSVVFQQTENISQLIEFQLVTGMSKSSYDTNSAAVNFCKSDTKGWSFVDSANIGLKNNMNCPSVSVPTNKALFDHQKRFINVADTDLPRSVILPTTLVESGVPVIVNDTTGHIKHYVFDCILKLRDLPFFKDMGSLLVKGSQFKIQVNMNIGSFVFNKAQTTGIISSAYANYNMKGNRLPWVVTDAKRAVSAGVTEEHNFADAAARATSAATVDEYPALQAGGASSLALNKTYTVSTVVGGAQGRARARLYVPAYTLESSVERDYLQLPVRPVRYSDYYSTVLRNKSGQISEVITNGLVGMKSLLIVPVLTTATNKAIPQMMSPFWPEPTAPGAVSCMRAIQLKVSGVNLFSQNVDYSHEMFLGELLPAKAINAGVEQSISSGLIGLDDFRAGGYSYLYFDLSRKSPEELKAALSLELQANIIAPAAVAYDLYVFVELDRTCYFNLQNGAVSLSSTF